MRFAPRRRRHPPAVIIVSLIDILLVVLIFMMVTTTFKQQPAVKIVLPESQQPKVGASEDHLEVTIDKAEPYFYLGKLPMTADRLQRELTLRAADHPKVDLIVRGDTDSHVGLLIKVMDMAKAANIHSLLFAVKPPGPP